MGQGSAKVYDPQPSQLFSPKSKTRRFSSGVATDIGGRPYQEDRFVLVDDLRSQFSSVTVPSALYIVLDGHGGQQCAEFVQSNFAEIFCATEEFQMQDYSVAFRVTFQKLETMWNAEALLQRIEGWSSGTCVLATLIVEEGVYVAWVGDCRMVGYSNHDVSHVQDITTDHKPSKPTEISRLIQAGANVQRAKLDGGCTCRNVYGPDRVFPGGLAIARSIGTIKCKDPKFGAVKGGIIAYPDIHFFNPKDGIRWLVMGSDGLWDYYPNSKQLSKVVCRKKNDEMIDASEMSQYLMTTIRTSNSLRRAPDNATILVLKL